MWLFTALIILLCGFFSFFGQLFGKTEELLKLLQMLTMYTLLSVSFICALCSKIRSFFKSSVNRLFWTTTLNARYLVKRAQILDLPNRGRCDCRQVVFLSTLLFRISLSRPQNWCKIFVSFHEKEGIQDMKNEIQNYLYNKLIFKLL